MKVWERGAGETMACGTGACAAVVAANEAGLVPAKAPARFPGGVLQIERLEGDEVLLTGPAVRVAEGVVDPSWLEAVLVRVAKRVESLPPYLFAELDRKLEARRAEGVDVISLGVGDPDLPTPEHIVEAMRRPCATLDPPLPELLRGARVPTGGRELVRPSVRRRARPGDRGHGDDRLEGGDRPHRVRVRRSGRRGADPRPRLPGLRVSTRLAEGRLSSPMAEDEGFLPDLDDALVSDRTKAIWLNFPSNPTAAVAELPTFEAAAAFAREHDLILLHDAACGSWSFDGFIAPSALQAPGAKEVALEFGSASKFYNMTGWRIGWAAGSAEAIRALGVVKTNLDSGQFTAISARRSPRSRGRPSTSTNCGPPTSAGVTWWRRP